MTTSNVPDDSLEKVAAEARVCTKCDLCKTRIKAVPGEGPADAEIFFIGEAPGLNEDRVGRPFVGAAGQFLDELLASASLQRSACFIGNVVKCRPPDNRNPTTQEIAACAPYLSRQLALIKPTVVVTLGRFSLEKFIKGEAISRIHGVLRNIDGQLVLPMYHPAAALHRADLRPTVLQDFQQMPLALVAARQHSSTLPPPETTPQVDEPPQQMKLF